VRPPSRRTIVAEGDDDTDHQVVLEFQPFFWGLAGRREASDFVQD